MSQYHIPLLEMVLIKEIRPVFNKFIKRPYNNGICILQHTMGACHYLLDAFDTCAGVSERILRSFSSLSNFLLETVNTDALNLLA